MTDIEEKVGLSRWYLKNVLLSRVLTDVPRNTGTVESPPPAGEREFPKCHRPHLRPKRPFLPRQRDESTGSLIGLGIETLSDLRRKVDDGD